MFQHRHYQLWDRWYYMQNEQENSLLWKNLESIWYRSSRRGNSPGWTDPLQWNWEGYKWILQGIIREWIEVHVQWTLDSSSLVVCAGPDPYKFPHLCDGVKERLTKEARGRKSGVFVPILCPHLRLPYTPEGPVSESMPGLFFGALVGPHWPTLFCSTVAVSNTNKSQHPCTVHRIGNTGSWGWSGLFFFPSVVIPRLRGETGDRRLRRENCTLQSNRSMILASPTLLNSLSLTALVTWPVHKQVLHFSMSSKSFRPSSTTYPLQLLRHL